MKRLIHKTLSQPADNRKLILLPALGMGGLFAAAAFSQIKLQTWERRSTLTFAQYAGMMDVASKDFARRGAVYTADGKPLAEDDDSYQLTVAADKVPHSDSFYLELAEATGIPAEEFSALAATKGKQRSWLEPIPSSRYQAIMALKSRWRADGLSLTVSHDRAYPMADAAACFVGVIRKQRPDKKKKKGNEDKKVETVMTGLESSENACLAGVDGNKIGLIDKSGDFIPDRMSPKSTGRHDGKDVVLTIDSDLQQVAYESVKKAVADNKADNGVAIVMDPHTGAILAMVNSPSFDPNETGVNQGVFGYNPAYMAQLEPGSTFKILTLAKALDDGKVTMHDAIDCRGEWDPVPGHPIHCDNHHGNRAHGVVTPLDAIARSCNVSAAIWATKIGRQPFFDFIDSLGLVDKSKLNLPGETPGLLRRKEYAKQLQLATIGFGQSVTCTPVSLIGAFAMIGNGGMRVEPHILAKVGDQTIQTSKPSKCVRPETAQTVMDCMTAVIQSDEGTGAKLRIPGYVLAGKTGTAQKIGKKQKGYVANFVGFVPARQPKAIILVMVNNPKNGKYYGAQVAGPVFEDIAKAVIRRLQIPPTEPIPPAKKRRTSVIAANPSKYVDE